MYKCYSRLVFSQSNTTMNKKDENEILNNIPHFIKNRLDVDCIQDGFVMYNDKLIPCKK